MSLRVGITIPNAAKFRAAFRQAPVLVRRHMDVAIRKTVLNIGRRSRQFTPVDTGRLRASTREIFSPGRGEVGTHTNYDIFVHEGTRFMRARPFLRDAVNVEEQKTDLYFTEELQKALNTIARNT